MRERPGGLSLSMKQGAPAEVLHPPDQASREAGDEPVIQFLYREYLVTRPG